VPKRTRRSEVPPHLRILCSAAVLAVAAIPAARAEERPTCFGEPATIIGTDAGDVLFLTPGHDVVVAGAGDDKIYDPTFEEDDPSESSPFPGPELTGDDVVCAGPGNDSIERALRVDAGPGDDWVRDGHTVDLGPGDDRLDNLECRPSRVWGGDGADLISAGFASWEEGSYEGDPVDELDEDCPEDDDMVDAGPGDDVVYGGDGADLLAGGEGDDVLEGWLGADRCSGGGGHDEIRHCDP
jgi:Ca2+-binding RTX toxin-like protein